MVCGLITNAGVWVCKTSTKGVVDEYHQQMRKARGRDSIWPRFDLCSLMAVAHGACWLEALQDSNSGGRGRGEGYHQQVSKVGGGG
jgi:hypothetical protein